MQLRWEKRQYVRSSWQRGASHWHNGNARSQPKKKKKENQSTTSGWITWCLGKRLKLGGGGTCTIDDDRECGRSEVDQSDRGFALRKLDGGGPRARAQHARLACMIASRYLHISASRQPWACKIKKITRGEKKGRLKLPPRP